MTAVLALTRAELTKIRTLRGVWVFTGVVLALHVFVLTQPMGMVAGALAAMAPDGTIEIFAGEPQQATRAVLDYLVASSLQMSLPLPMLAAVIAGQEFRAGQLRVSVLAVPRRGRLLTAKTLAVCLFLLVVAVVLAGISTAFMYVEVREWNPGVLLSAGALLGQARFVAFAVLFSLTGFAITVLARNTLAGVAAVVVLIVLTMTQAVAAVAPALDALLPVSAGRNLLLDGELSRLTAGPGHAFVVLAAWAVAGTLLAGVALGRRDT